MDGSSVSQCVKNNNNLKFDHVTYIQNRYDRKIFKILRDKENKYRLCILHSASTYFRVTPYLNIFFPGKIEGNHSHVRYFVRIHDL